MNSNNFEIQQYMAEELAAGKSLSEIQTLINEKFKTRMTYMEVRIMASELKDVDWNARTPAKPAETVQDVTKVPAPAQNGENAAPATGTTTVELNRVVRAGALAEGTVQFGSGASGSWVIDQTGRLGFDKLSGEPTEQDIQEFQTELRKVLR